MLLFKKKKAFFFKDGGAVFLFVLFAFLSTHIVGANLRSPKTDKLNMSRNNIVISMIEMERKK